MEQQAPPIKLFVRAGFIGVIQILTHSPMFHQVEGLVVDEGIGLT